MKHYVVCENKCLIESYSKQELDEKFDALNTNVNVTPEYIELLWEQIGEDDTDTPLGTVEQLEQLWEQVTEDTGGTSEVVATNSVNYTFVVDSDEALYEWASNDRSKGQDYTSVLIRKGTWTIDSTIDLKTTDTFSVVGESGNKLVFNVLQFGFAYNQNGSVDPLELLHLGLSIKGVNVEVNVLSGGMGGGFYNLVNLLNCTSVINNSSTAMGFYACYNLSNCSCQIAGDNALNSAGFSGCVNLHDCIAEAHGNTMAMAFEGCRTLTGCFGKGVGGTGYGFYMCYGVSRCMALKGSSTGGFGESYASLGSESYPCADTPDGGFNIEL